MKWEDAIVKEVREILSALPLTSEVKHFLADTVRGPVTHFV